MINHKEFNIIFCLFRDLKNLNSKGIDTAMTMDEKGDGFIFRFEVIYQNCNFKMQDCINLYFSKEEDCRVNEGDIEDVIANINDFIDCVNKVKEIPIKHIEVEEI